MSDLNDEARSLFDAARAGYEPSEADKKRVLRNVLLRAGVAVAVTSAANTARAGLARGSAWSGVAGLGLKGLASLAIVGSVGVFGYALTRGGSSRTVAVATSTAARASGTSITGFAPVAVAVAPPAVAVATSAASASRLRKPEAASAAPTRVSVSQREVDPRPAQWSLASASDVPVARTVAADASGSATFPAPQLPESKRTATRSGSVPSGPPSTLSVEARGLAKVQRNLKEGKNQEALRLVEEQRQRFAHGELQSERSAARILALCAVGRIAEAREAARTFLNDMPRSPLSARIRGSCVAQ